MTIPFFRGEKCRREFGSRNEAAQCEAGYLIPITTTVIRYTTKPYPYSIEITFSNGEKRVYNAEDLGG